MPIIFTMKSLFGEYYPMEIFLLNINHNAVLNIEVLFSILLGIKYHFGDLYAYMSVKQTSLQPKKIMNC